MQEEQANKPIASLQTEEEQIKETRANKPIASAQYMNENSEKENFSKLLKDTPQPDAKRRKLNTAACDFKFQQIVIGDGAQYRVPVLNFNTKPFNG